MSIAIFCDIYCKSSQNYIIDTKIYDEYIETLTFPEHRIILYSGVYCVYIFTTFYQLCLIPIFCYITIQDTAIYYIYSHTYCCTVHVKVLTRDEWLKKSKVVGTGKK